MTHQTYGQYCPVAKAAEIVGQRWTLLIVRDLSFGPLRFNELARGLPGVNRSLLAARLRLLGELGLVHRDKGRYRLTAAGQQLGAAARMLGEWAARWIIEDPAPAEVDPELLGLWLSRHIAADALPERRVVVDFALSGPRPGRFWLVLERGSQPSLCRTDPGLDAEAYVYVRGATRDLYRVYMGRVDLQAALADGRVALDGAPALMRAFGSWFSWSGFAPIVRHARVAAAG